MSRVVENTLPDGWEKVELGSLSEYINGYAFKPKDWSSKGLPIIRIQNLNGKDEYNFYDSEIKNKYKVFDGDILISWSASLDVYKWNGGNAVLNQHIFNTNINTDIISKEFFFHTIKYSLAEMGRNLHGMGMKHITKGKFERILVPLPPLKEQKRIVAKIDTLFAKIDKAISLTEESLKQAENLLPSVLKLVFEKGKTDGWEEKKWDEVLEIKNGKSQKEFLVDDGGYPIYGSGGLMNGRVSKFLCPKNTTIVGRKGTIDKPKYIEEDFWNVDTAFGLCSKTGLNPRFLYYFCLTFNFRSLNKSTTLPSLTKRDLLQIRMPITTSENQMKVVKIADDVLLKSKLTQSKLEEQLVYLKQLKSSILSKAFKGAL